MLKQSFCKLRLGGEQWIIWYFKDGAEVCLLSGFFDKTKIRRPKEYGKYNTEVTEENFVFPFVEFLIWLDMIILKGHRERMLKKAMCGIV